MNQARDKYGRWTDDGSDGLPSRSEIAAMIMRRNEGKPPVLINKPYTQVADVDNTMTDAAYDTGVQLAEVDSAQMEKLKQINKYQWADVRAEERAKETAKYNNGINSVFNNAVAAAEKSEETEKKSDLIDNNLLKAKESKGIEATEVIGSGYGAVNGKINFDEPDYQYEAIGRYQLRNTSLRDIKWMRQAGEWTQFAKDNGVSDYHDFLSKPEAQEKAMEAYMRNIEKYSKKSEIFLDKEIYSPFESGQKIKITYSGLMGSGHGQGAGGT